MQLKEDPPVIRHAIGVPLIYASVGIVLLLWVLAVPVESRYESTSAILKSFANVAAFSGTVLYAWSVFLSARFLFLDGWFGGLDKAYKWHHITGGVAFLLLALHPFFLSWRAIAANRPATVMWMLGSNWQINFGILSLYAIALLLPVSIFLRVKYGMFVWLHRILGGVFLLGFLHAFLAKGNMVKFWPLWVYMFIVCMLAVVAYVYHSVLGAIVPRRYRYTVARIRDIGGGTSELILEPTGRLLRFTPGQFAYVSLVSHPMGDEAHPYSMAASPIGRQLRFVVKALGDYTARLHEVKPGTTALLEGPHGGFSFRFVRGRKQVWVAGGIGVTPFLAMAQSLPRRKYQVDFYYCVVKANEAHFDEELQAIAKKNPSFQAHLFCQDKQGFMNADVLTKGRSLQKTEFFICGPPPMMKALHAGLLAKGVPDRHIHFEDFSLR